LLESVLLLGAAAAVMANGGRTMLADLESDDVAIRHRAIEQVLAVKGVVDHRAIKAIADKYIAEGRKKGTVRDALRLLGKLQAREYIPYLVSLLPLRVHEDDSSRPPEIATTFPAAGALIDLGLPSIRPVLERLQHESDPDALLAGAGVLRKVLGRDGALKFIRAEMKTAPRDETPSLTKVQELLKTHYMLM
jgi:hypothetical protein